ncbi:MAG: hypothetical protein HOV80_25835 [Polyangiaceae bacterium]|nr:hypothetical protein [Polyangiaceae bacterium]
MLPFLLSGSLARWSGARLAAAAFGLLACDGALGTGGGDQGGGFTGLTDTSSSATGSSETESTGSESTGSQSTGSGGSAGSWTLRQSQTKNWDAGDPTWQGGNEVSFTGVAQGSTLILAVYGYSYPTTAYGVPTDSMGQPIVPAVQTDIERSVQAAAWVMHDAAAGDHSWTGLPDLSTGDGKLFFMEFDPGGAPSSTIVGAATAALHAYEPPWLTTGSVTLSSGVGAGDLLVALSFQEEGSVGHSATPYTDPPDGWFSLGVQNDTTHNIAGAACWRIAPDESPQTVTWSWQITGAQDPTVFKAAAFAVRAP